MLELDDHEGQVNPCLTDSEIGVSKRGSVPSGLINCIWLSVSLNAMRSTLVSGGSSGSTSTEVSRPPRTDITTKKANKINRLVVFLPILNRRIKRKFLNQYLTTLRSESTLPQISCLLRFQQSEKQFR